MPPTENQVPTQEKIHPLLIPFSIIVAGALIGAGIFLSSKSQTSVRSTQIPNVPATINMLPVTAEDHILGNPNAPVMIVEYSDTECPFCKVFHLTMKRVMAEYGTEGKVAWVYRHFPIAELHSRAQKEAEATECVAELGGNEKFWKYLDTIFVQTNSNDSLDPAALPAIAKSIGIDEKKFNECLSSGKYATKILASIQDAQRAGSEGTPNTILITRDGQKATIQGAQPYETLKAVIDVAIANQ